MAPPMAQPESRQTNQREMSPAERRVRWNVDIPGPLGFRGSDGAGGEERLAR